MKAILLHKTRPGHPDERIDPEALAHNLERLAAAGVGGDAVVGFGAHDWGVDVSTIERAEDLGGFVGDEPFFLVGSDHVLEFDLNDLAEAHRDSLGVATLAVYPAVAGDPTTAHATWVEIDRSGRVLRLVGGRDEPSLVYKSSSCACVEGRFAPDVGAPGGLIHHILQAQGIMSAHVVNGRCVPVPLAEPVAERSH